MLNSILNKYKPAVNNSILFFLAGLAWSGVGVMLIKKAISWIFVNDKIPLNYIVFVLGIILGVVVAIFGFSKVANKNINRINKKSNKSCIFGFIAWKSYLLIIFMVGLGITLRHSSLPKLYLSVIYNGVGLGLFLASFRYFKEIL